MRQHVTILGVLFIVFGSLGLIGAFILALLFGGAAGIVGIVAQTEPDAAVALPIVSLVGTIVVLLVFLLSIPELVAGIGLIKFRPWARILSIVICVLNLLKFPMGTLVGGYGMWVLLSGETEELFRGR